MAAKLLEKTRPARFRWIPHQAKCNNKVKVFKLCERDSSLKHGVPLGNFSSCRVVIFQPCNLLISVCILVKRWSD